MYILAGGKKLVLFPLCEEGLRPLKNLSPHGREGRKSSFVGSAARERLGKGSRE